MSDGRGAEALFGVDSKGVSACGWWTRIQPPGGLFDRFCVSRGGVIYPGSSGSRGSGVRCDREVINEVIS